MSWLWAALVLVVGAALFAPAVYRWWVRRAWTNPRRDPGAGRATKAMQEALDELLASPGDPAGVVARGLAICELDDELSWRGGLQRLAPFADRLGTGPDADAMRAELALRLGRVEQARAACAGLPPDHWRACRVRAGLYAIDGDDERADSGWVAAAQLAPKPERERLYRGLDERRRRRGFRATPPLSLWERPPEG